MCTTETINIFTITAEIICNGLDNSKFLVVISEISHFIAKYIPTDGSQNQIYSSSLFLRCPET